jgi:hypothetical protein
VVFLLSEDKINNILKQNGVTATTRLKTVLLAFGTYDFVEKEVLERELGHEKAKELRSKIWSSFFATAADRCRKQFGGRDVDIPMMGFIMKRLQEENFCVPYEIEENTAERHVGYIRRCPLWGDKDSLMEEALGERLHKDLLTLDNVYDISQIEVGAMVKRLGMGDEVNAILDNCMCLGGDPKLGCRVVIEKKR